MTTDEGKKASSAAAVPLKRPMDELPNVTTSEGKKLRQMFSRAIGHAGSFLSHSSSSKAAIEVPHKAEDLDLSKDS